MSDYSSDDGYGDDVSVSQSDEQEPYSEEAGGQAGGNANVGKDDDDDDDDYSMSDDSGGQGEAGEGAAKGSARSGSGGGSSSSSSPDSYASDSASRDGGGAKADADAGGREEDADDVYSDSDDEKVSFRDDGTDSRGGSASGGGGSAGRKGGGSGEGGSESDYSSDDGDGDGEDVSARASSARKSGEKASSHGDTTDGNGDSDIEDETPKASPVVRDDSQDASFNDTYEVEEEEPPCAQPPAEDRPAKKGRGKPRDDVKKKRIIPRPLDSTHTPLHNSQQRHIEALERSRQQRDLLGGESILIPQFSPSKQVCRQKVHERKVVVAAVRRPGETPSTRLPPSLAPFSRRARVGGDSSTTKRAVVARGEGAVVAADGGGSAQRPAQVAHPRDVSVEEVTPQSVIFSWRDPVGMTPQLAEHVQYRVKISMDRGRTYPIDFTTTDKCCEVGNLTPNAMYRLVVLTTFPADPPTPVELTRKHASVHFHTQPIPQILMEPVAKASLSVPVVRAKRSPLYSSISMDAWLKK